MPLSSNKSKQKRDDLPQVTIGLAVNRKGIPVRCWVLPGNQHDSQCVDQVQKDLNNWNLGRVVIWLLINLTQSVGDTIQPFL